MWTWCLARKPCTACPSCWRSATGTTSRRRAGASERNGTTNTDRTNYFETVPSNQLEVALWLESDRMAFLLDHADEKTFASQREVVKNERRQNYENAPYGLGVPPITILYTLTSIPILTI